MSKLLSILTVFSCWLAILPSRGVSAVPNSSARSHYERPTAKSGPYKERVIVFVHGIFGDADSTWRYSSVVYWPRLLLTDDMFRDSDVYVANYPTPYLGNTMNVDEEVTNLNNRLTSDGVFSKHREVVFVCHSLGGLVVQRLLLTFRDHAQQVPFIYFFSTPETGAQIAKLAGVFSADPLLKEMFPGDSNDYLLNLENEWRGAQFHIRRFCAYETKKYRSVLVVDRLSGTRNCDEPPIPINEDHLGIVKPDSAEHDSYIALRNAVLAIPILRKPSRTTISNLSIIKTSTFSTLVPFHGEWKNSPIPLDENLTDPHEEYYGSLIALASRPDQQPEGWPAYRDRKFESMDEQFAFVTRLIQFEVFRSIYFLQRGVVGGIRWTAGVGVTPINKKPVIVPDTTEYPTKELLASLSGNEFLNPRDEMLWKGRPFSVPAGTHVSFLEHSNPEKGQVFTCTVHLEKPGYFKLDFEVQPGPGMNNQLPAGFKTLAVQGTTTFSVNVAMSYAIQRRRDHGFQPEHYADWADALFSGLKESMGFESAPPSTIAIPPSKDLETAATTGQGANARVLPPLVQAGGATNGNLFDSNIIDNGQIVESAKSGVRNSTFINNSVRPTGSASVPLIDTEGSIDRVCVENNSTNGAPIAKAGGDITNLHVKDNDLTKHEVPSSGPGIDRHYNFSDLLDFLENDESIEPSALNEKLHKRLEAEWQELPTDQRQKNRYELETALTKLKAGDWDVNVFYRNHPPSFVRMPCE